MVQGKSINSSRFMKLGWADRNFPDVTYPSLIGRPMLRYEAQLEDVKLKVNDWVMGRV